MSNHERQGDFRRFSHVIFPRCLSVAAFLLVSIMPVHAFSSDAAKSPAAAAPGSDVIVFTNGDQLTGKLLEAVDGKVTFHSDVVGDISVKWNAIQSLHTAQHFAVIQQGQKVTRKTSNSDVPQGTIAVEHQQIEVTAGTGAAPKEISTQNAEYVVNQAAFDKAVNENPSWLHNWTGSATAGIALVEATQKSRSFNTAFTATRTIPNVAWLPPRQRTILDFSDVYGSLSQPGVPTVKTSVLHAGAEQDWYLSPRLFALATAIFSHDYSQGLDLQQIYGAGLGYTAIKDAEQQLDLKADVHYERQSFGQTPGFFPPVITPSKNLVGINVGDVYMRKFGQGMVFNQALTVTPALNQVKAFSALFTAGLLFPVYKHFGFSTGVLDAFLNDPAAGSNRNSFQFTGGVTYTFQ